MARKNRRIIVLTIFAFVFFQYSVFAEKPLTMDEVVEIALKNSHVIDIAREGAKSAAAQKKEALTGFLPKVNTFYSYTRLNEAPFTRFEGLPSPYSALNGKELTVGTKENFNWTFEVKQPLFAGGAILANYQASAIGEDAARIEEAAKVQDVVQDVKIAYFNVLRAQRILEATRQSVEMLNAHCNIAKNYFRVGMIPKNDLLHAEVELANGEQALIRAQNAVDLAKSRLNTILKRQMFAPIDVADILTYQPLKKTYEDCLKIARQERPELKISSLRAAQAGKLVRMSKSEYLPALNLVGNYTRYGDNPSTSGSAYRDMENWQVMAVASWNLWEWGKTKYRVDATKARENQAISSSRELNDQIALEIKYAYLLLQEAESQIAVSQKVIRQAQENFRISEERYQQNISTSTVVLEAQTLLTKAKSEYANALGDYNINYARLQRAMGTIWGAEERNYAGNAGESPAVSAAENSAWAGGPKKAAKSLPEEQVRRLIDEWLASWQAGDMETYRDCYVPDFHSKKKDLPAWIAWRARDRGKSVNIRIDNLKVSLNAGASAAKASFTQYYRSSTHQTKVKKTLMFRKEKGEWKICRETFAVLK